MKQTQVKSASAGEQGVDVRSDCYVQIELRGRGGVEIELRSKVKSLYGDSIQEQLKEILAFFGIVNARLLVEDSGALPFVIYARLEAAIKKLTDTSKEYLPEIIPNNMDSSKKDMHRFSRLYLPGNTPRLMINAGIHKPSGMILDLEDSVAPERKHEARFLVRNALRQLHFYRAERMVRINQVPMGLDDLEYIIPHFVNLVLVPKCEDAGQIRQVNERIKEIQHKNNVRHQVWLMPIVESALGVVKSYEIASAADNVVGLAIGLEDYTADLGTKRTQEGTESFFARSQVVNAARAAGIQPIDSVFSDVADMEGLKQSVIHSKALGFEGMGCIHPRQIKVIHEYYAPDEVEIEKAKKIVLAFDTALSKGLGVVSLGSKMIDPPVVKRAQKTIDLAVLLGKLDAAWKTLD